MKRRIALVLVLALALGSFAFVGAASGGALARTRVTIQGPNGDFSGKLRSDDPGCLDGRIVKLFMSSSESGPFGRIASDTSEVRNGVGVWSAGNTGFRDGFFFAKAKRTTECRGGRSLTIELVDGVEQ